MSTPTQGPRCCAVCSRLLTWPSVEFCTPGCSEAWVRRAAEEEPGLVERQRAKRVLGGEVRGR